MKSSHRPTRRWLMAGLGVAAASALALTGCSSASGDAGVPGLDAALGSGFSGAGGSSSDDAGPAISVNGKNSDMVTASVTATGAASGQVRDGALRLTYPDGSTEDVSAFINCSAISHLINDDAGLVLIYPDGELDCRAER